MAELPLHPGTTPRWLFERMKRLAEAIVKIMINEKGSDEFLRRISDPFWFQAFSCVLGFDWHSSGTTTVTCGALKSALSAEEHGVMLAGGKGKVSRKTPFEIEEIGDKLNISSEVVDKLKYSSRMCAKVDTAGVQDGYPLYHHVLIFNENGKWAVIQQGLNPDINYARRYHWLSEKVQSFVEEPHKSIIGKKSENTLNMVAKESKECQKVCVDLVKDKPEKIMKFIKRDLHQKSLLEWMGEEKKLFLPNNINWKALRDVYEFQPKNYEEFLGRRGVGPSTVRALALISEVIYGTPPSWKDPVKYSFAVGGKDGVPFPVNKKMMDDVIDILKEGINEAKIGRGEKLRAFERLRKFVPKDAGINRC